VIPFSSDFKNKIYLIHSAFTRLTPDIVNNDFPEVNSQLASLKRYSHNSWSSMNNHIVPS